MKNVRYFAVSADCKGRSSFAISLLLLLKLSTTMSRLLYALHSQCANPILTLLKVSVVTISFVTIIGCAPRSFDKNTLEEVTSPSLLPDGPVALVIAESAIETINELGAYNSYYKNSLTARLYTESIRRAYVETSEPDFSVLGVTQILKTKFGEVHQFRSFEEAASSRLTQIVTLNMKTKLINNRASEPASYLSLEFRTPDGRYLGTVHGRAELLLTPLWAHNKRENEIVAEIRQQGEVQRRALQLLEQRLEEIPTE